MNWKDINWINIKSFIQGETRVFLLKYAPSLVRKHIKEQYEWRLIKANPECLKQGQCVYCSCKTPDVQLANKPCWSGCYPPMMNKVHWNWFKTFNQFNGQMNNPEAAKLNWDTTFHDLGKVTHKEPVTLTFKYLGDGVIESANPSCGCVRVTFKGNVVTAIYTPNEIKVDAKLDTKKIKVAIKSKFGLLIDDLTITALVTR